MLIVMVAVLMALTILILDKFVKRMLTATLDAVGTSLLQRVTAEGIETDLQYDFLRLQHAKRGKATTLVACSVENHLKLTHCFHRNLTHPIFA
ncbi:MAG TPA: hypothetical protein VIF82_13925 [Burkholderiaceae bacterium]